MTAPAPVGLLAYGVYVPRHRLDRASIGAALGTPGGAGTRSVAGYDEDATSMAVEACRAVLGDRTVGIDRLVLATPAPPYLDKSNAAVAHAALGLDPRVLAFDCNGAVRSSVGAMAAAIDSRGTTMVALADVRTGLPGGLEERDSGDAAAALVFGPGTPALPVLAEVLASSALTEELLDRWRSPGDDVSRTWEERFGESAYVPLADAAFADALKQADLLPGDVDHLVVAGLHLRANRAFASGSGVVPDEAADLQGRVGNTGAAAPGVLLAEVLDRAVPGAVIALVVIADGASVVLLRATDALPGGRPPIGVRDAVRADGVRSLPYATFLSWKGQLSKEPPRRPDPVGPAGPPALRSNGYKHGFVGSRCDGCGTIHLPPGRVCLRCSAVDQMSPVAMAGRQGTVMTFTVDHLAHTPSPPLVAVVVDFDGGGRFKCQLTDCDPDSVAIGQRVEMTFRRLVTANGVHNYFWKARPLGARPSTEG